MVIGFAATLCLSQSAGVSAQPALSASLSAGADGEATVIARGMAGGLYGFGKFAAEGHITFENFLRLDNEQGLSAKSFSVLDLGVRYGILSKRFVGPYLSAGASYGFFLGNPHERKTKDPETCATAPNPDACSYYVDRDISTHVGFGWGFANGEKTTVAVRLDVTYWMLSLLDGEDQPDDAPNPVEVARPQGSWSVLLGFEFMRWP